MKSFQSVLLICIILSMPALSRQYIVTSVNDTAAGSFSRQVLLVAAGDTIGFSFPGPDSLVDVPQQVLLSKDLVVLGRNLVSGKRVILNCTGVLPGESFFRVTGGNVSIRDAILWGYGISVTAHANLGGVLCVVGFQTKLSLTNVDVSSGYADVGGGGIYNDSGTVTLSNCTVSNNFSGAFGGGIANRRGVMIITNSMISNNSASTGGYSNGYGYGGGVYNLYGYLCITGSTISGNKCQAGSPHYIDGLRELAYGGGIYTSYGTTTCTNSTICNNSCSASCVCCNCTATALGSGICTDGIGICSLAYCTIFNNASTGIAAIADNIHFVNTLVAANGTTDLSNENASGPSYVGVNNLATIVPNGDSAAFGSGGSKAKIMGKDTILLAANGGPLPTVAIFKGAKAIGAGIRAGYYLLDTLINKTSAVTVQMPAYFKNAAWYDLQTDSLVPPGKTVAEITVDQRGIIRHSPSCVGAYEFDSTDKVAVPTNYPNRFDRLRLFTIHGNRLAMQTPVAALYEIRIFDLTGRTICRLHVLAAAQSAQEIQLPGILAQGTYIAGISGSGLKAVARILVQ